jgi:hypothetical protein
LQIPIEKKQQKNVEYLNYLGSMIKHNAIYTREIKFRIFTRKATCKRKKTLFTSKMDLNLRKKPVKCYTRSIALYGAENMSLWKVDQKYLVSFGTWCWRRMELIIWTNRVRK